MVSLRSPSVLMFGWEFPPFNSGGLGVACEGLSKALSASGVDLTFVLPLKVPISASWCKFVFASEASEFVDETQITKLFLVMKILIFLLQRLKSMVYRDLFPVL